MNSKKSEVLLNEARKDIQIQNLNKAVSALYFSVRRELESILEKMKVEVPRCDDKLANVLKHMGFSSEAEDFLHLYTLREKADYDDRSVTEEAREAILIATSLLDTLRKMYKP
ncbi:hypothetical protein L3N51_01033 [Metallosphaera sp. J1]|uniref:HEPN domain-containing protein n=1 Tax=Metallosphaera javensis (ex Hofmann et al. 2022) TaxID=99938 RepID=UPI001EDD7DAB|nr:HEPN domain-containing protein [Metallosphaera javensis (ex Hofmann et al. 2022)]MCG3108747.1 hypothetical protein [Metallosphaera javensis (ex Hofmann et al. 2022)]